MILIFSSYLLFPYFDLFFLFLLPHLAHGLLPFPAAHAMISGFSRAIKLRGREIKEALRKAETLGEMEGEIGRCWKKITKMLEQIKREKQQIYNQG